MEFVLDTETTESLSPGKETTPEMAFIDASGLDTSILTENVEPMSKDPELGEKEMEALLAARVLKAKARTKSDRPITHFIGELIFFLVFSITKNRRLIWLVLLYPTAGNIYTALPDGGAERIL